MQAERPQRPWYWAGMAWLVLPISIFVLLVAIGQRAEVGFLVFTGLLLLQLVLGIGAVVSGDRSQRAAGHGHGAAAVGALASLTAVAAWFGGAFLAAFAMGGGWGRPLRVRG